MIYALAFAEDFIDGRGPDFRIFPPS